MSDEARNKAWLQRLKDARPDVYAEATLDTDLFQLMLEKRVHESNPGMERIRQKLKDAIDKKK